MNFKCFCFVLKWDTAFHNQRLTKNKYNKSLDRFCSCILLFISLNALEGGSELRGGRPLNSSPHF